MTVGLDDGAGDSAGMQGVAVGIVTDVDDPEELGRVRLEFPWRDADDTSDWARIATPMAGPEAGLYMAPEPGDEVLVAFADGDIQHPYVIGGLWNGEDRPPAGDGGPAARTIRSRTGHEVVLDDDEQGGAVTVRSAGGHEIRLGDAAGDDAITVTDSAGGVILKADSTGGVTLSAGTSLTLEAPTLELAADGNLTLDAGGVLTLNGALITLN